MSDEMDMSVDAMTGGPAMALTKCACGKRHTFEFDEFAHKYTLDGKEIPSVSRLSELSGLAREFNAAAELGAEGGTNAHSWCEIDDKGELDQYEMNADGERTLAEWRQAKTALGIERFEGVEVADYTYVKISDDLGGVHFAGTADRIYVATKHPMWPAGTRVLLDIKRQKDPKASKLYRFKTACYAMIFGCQARELCYLKGGEFSANDIRKGGNMDYLTATTDREAVMDALRFVQWRRIG